MIALSDKRFLRNSFYGKTNVNAAFDYYCEIAAVTINEFSFLDKDKIFVRSLRVYCHFMSLDLDSIQSLKKEKQELFNTIFNIVNNGNNRRNK